MNLDRNDYVQWTGTDTDGKFSHVGQVISCGDEVIAFTTKTGILTVPTTDGHFRQISRPQDWDIELPVVLTDTKQPVKVTQESKTKRKAKFGSKKQLSLDIYESMMDNDTHPKRVDVIIAFMEQLTMTKAGASTYQNACKKHFS